MLTKLQSSSVLMFAVLSLVFIKIRTSCETGEYWCVFVESGEMKKVLEHFHLAWGCHCSLGSQLALLLQSVSMKGDNLLFNGCVEGSKPYNDSCLDFSSWLVFSEPSLVVFLCRRSGAFSIVGDILVPTLNRKWYNFSWLQGNTIWFTDMG